MLTQAVFHTHLSALNEFPDRSRYLLAVSGGVDSMVLLHLFTILNLKFEVAHVNYKLRAAESDADQRIVEDFCSKHHLTLHVYEVSDQDLKPESSVQLWARELRYDFFRKIQDQSDLPYLVTAHHLNDQLETFIINLSRGSGLKGLSGIPASENKILRPLLNFSKAEIYGFAKLNEIGFREDRSNATNNYLRNFIRNEITPNLLETNAQFLSNFEKSITFLSQTKNFVEEQISSIENEMTSKQGAAVIINRPKLMAQSHYVKFEILRKFGFSSELEIQKIASAEKGKCFNTATHTLTVDRDFLSLTPITKEDSIVETTEIIIAKDASKTGDFLSLSDFITLDRGFTSKFLWEFDSEKIQFPLKLRHKQEGDLFYPAGMQGRKTISKFFKDEKIPIFAQREIWLLCDRHNVLGVIPIRQDRRFAAGPQTKNKISIKI